MQNNPDQRNAKLLKHIKTFTIILEKSKAEFIQKWKDELKQNRNLNDFELKRTLGTGAFGRVVLAKEKDKKSYFAVKVLEKKHLVQTSQITHCKYEIKILNCVRFPFLISMEFFFIDNVYLYIGMDFVNGGEMFIQLKSMRKFDEELSKFYAAQIILSFEYLHNVGVIYRDLKPENIMVSKDGYIKLTDFGFCKKIDDNRTYTLCGTPEYLAPEIILSKGYSFAVDWWSLGILMFEMCAGYPPFQAKSPMKLFEKAITGKYIFPSHFSKHIRHLVSKLIVVQNTERYGVLKNGANDIKSHQWYKNFDWDALYTKRIKPPVIPKFSTPSVTSTYFTRETGFRNANDNEYKEEFASFSI